VQQALTGLGQNLYELISHAEGTWGPGGIDYNKVYGGGTADLVHMTLAQVQEYQSRMRGPTPVGGFQINKATIADAMRQMHVDPGAMFDPAMQQKMADWAAHTGRGLRRWSTLEGNPELLARAHGMMGGGGGAGGGGGPGPAMQAGPDAAAHAVDRMMQLRGVGRFAPAIRDFLKAGGVNLDPRYAAWCAAFVNSAFGQEGMKGATNVARSFLNWGTGVDPHHAAKGDVLVLPRGSETGTGGHVGLATGKHIGDMVEMIQGNKGGAVRLSWEHERELRARRGEVNRQQQQTRHLSGISQPRREVTINVHGSHDPHGTGAQAARWADRLSGESIRNKRPIIS
jgi:uncharacterized protein (TIGR02594 family)